MVEDTPPPTLVPDWSEWQTVTMQFDPDHVTVTVTVKVRVRGKRGETMA